MPAFHFRHIKDLYPVFWTKSAELIQAISSEASTSRYGSDVRPTSIEVNGWASRGALDIIGVAGMGRDFGAIQDPENDLNQTYRKIFAPGRTGQILGILDIFLPSWLVQRIP